MRKQIKIFNRFIVILRCDLCDRIIRNAVYEDGFHFCIPWKHDCYKKYDNFKHRIIANYRLIKE